MFELRYPDEMSPTLSWVPSQDPTQNYSEGIPAPVIVHRMADPRVVYVYAIAGSYAVNRYHFGALEDNDKTGMNGLTDFFQAVLGASMRIRDPISGSYFTGMFHPDILQRDHGLEWQPYGAKYWSVDVPILRTA